MKNYYEPEMPKGAKDNDDLYQQLEDALKQTWKLNFELDRLYKTELTVYVIACVLFTVLIIGGCVGRV